MSADPRPFVSVKFTPAGRKHSFLLPDLLIDEGLRPGTDVVVESADGQELGTVTRVPSALAERRRPAEASSNVVVRRATHQDVVQRLKHQQREQEAHRIAQLKIRERGLTMKLTRVEYPFDGSRMIFYYTAETRVDFRELVRDLAGHFHVRIEMRQIGVRDEAKLLADYGDCGKPVCCNTHMAVMPPVSMRMAKLQKSTLDPSKISGRCGRLKCCLRFEQDVYEELQHELPPPGSRIVTSKGQGRVLAQEILAQKLLVEFEDGRRLVVAAQDILTRL
jgi:cell fate regulator YaaT (PSP1 superfamily)